MKKRKELRLSDKTPSQQFKIKLASDIIFACINFMDKLTKRYVVNFDASKEPAIYALWHGLQYGAGCFPVEHRKNLHILISLSNDGELISQVCHKMGFSLIRGSQQREGEQATREMIRTLENGGNVIFMVDGPIGPKHKVKKGIIKLAKMSQKPIIPVAPCMKTLKVNSWDEMHIPFQIAPRTSLLCGEPLYVPHDADEIQEKECRLKLEQDLFDLYEEVQKKHKEYWGKNG